MEENLEENELKEEVKTTETIDKKFLIGILVTVLPFWGYLIAYGYEYGYSITLNIPVEFISIRIENILSITFVIYVISMYILLNFHLASGLIFEFVKQSALKRFIILNLFFYSFLVGISFKLNVSYLSWIMNGFLFILYVLLPLIFPLFRRDKKISFSEQFTINSDKDSQNDTFLNRIAKKYSRKILLNVLYVLLLTASSVIIGELHAENTKVFNILNNDKSKVVVRIYDKKLILVKTNELMKKNINRVYVVDTSVLNSFELSNYNPYNDVEKNKPQISDSTKTK